MSYMAPELWRATTVGRLLELTSMVGSLCDVYSLGLMMWEALSCYAGHQTPAETSPVRRLYALILSCLHFEATSRPSATQVAAELKQLQCVFRDLKWI